MPSWNTPLLNGGRHQEWQGSYSLARARTPRPESQPRPWEAGTRERQQCRRKEEPERDATRGGGEAGVDGDKRSALAPTAPKRLSWQDGAERSQPEPRAARLGRDPVPFRRHRRPGYAHVSPPRRAGTLSRWRGHGPALLLFTLVSRKLTFFSPSSRRGHLLSETISRLICNIDLNTFIRAQSLPSNLSALPAQNLLADPVNSRLPNQDTQEEMDIFTKAALLVNVLLSIYL
ncbi:uncharacterized protein LOC144325095 isoform X2 [Podarcis muralis]